MNNKLKIFFLQEKSSPSPGNGIFSFLFFVCCLTLNPDGFCQNVNIGKTHVKIKTGSSIVFPSNVKISGEAGFSNNGTASFINKQEAGLYSDCALEGDGLYSISGQAGFTVSGTSISNMEVNNNGNTTFINSDLSVTQILTLSSGIVDVADGKVLKILNTNQDAILYNDSYMNTSFVYGTLGRNVNSDQSYSFPVGSAGNGFHPCKLDKLTSSGMIMVSYLPDFDTKWNNIYENEKNIHLENLGGWNVTSNNIDFYPYLSLYQTSGVISGYFNLFYSESPFGNTASFTIDNNSGLTADQLFVTAYKTKYTTGYFAVNAIKTEANSDGTEMPKIVNLIIANGDGRKKFEIPGIENYKKVSLYVYNRFGILVYKSDNYANDFNTEDYNDGTYFYDLTLTTSSDRKMFKRSFFEIVRRKN